jgi:hypothetical protein
MARHYIRTTVTYFYESDNDEFASEADAEAFGWKFDEMMYDGVDEIKVEEFENEEEEDEEDGN